MPEFTGERLIPGQVEPDLWNEHFARYAFALRLARHKRVLDVACGAGYGSAELARVAHHVTGTDISEEAVAAARENYRAHNLEYRVAAAQALPFDDASFDLVVAFEVIEHLADWKVLLTEARRLLAPGGQFVVSTPNRLYYAEQRRLAGPNPFHAHEFDFEEFRSALEEAFPSVRLFVQNHSEAIAFQPAEPAASGADVLVQKAALAADESHFFLAVCALSPQTGAPTFIYVPAAGNVLREREHHIRKLEGELAEKDAWLENLKAQHAGLTALHTRLTEELRERGLWAQKLEEEIAEARANITGLLDHIGSYEKKVRELEQDLAARTAAAQENERRLEAELARQVEELAKAVRLLHDAERTVEERTTWALELQSRVEELEAVVRAAGASRWVRLGRSIGLGPTLPDK